jgi:hypothetical protein
VRRLLTFLTLAATLLPSMALATSPSLQVHPLKYQSTMLGSDVENGYVDVSNPSDAPVNVQSQVQAFKQTDLAGDLSFYNDQTIAGAITLSITQFQIGPQQAIRVPFSVDPRKLPKGGVYAVIFFRTVPPAESATTSFVTESADVGTLLLLQNGASDQHIGRVTQFNLPVFQLGSGITGSAHYKNTNTTHAPVAFSPQLSVKIQPLGKATTFVGPYVLPLSTRSFQVDRPGSYFGLLPVSIIDHSTGLVTTKWVIACTGIYAFLLLYLLAILIVWSVARLARRLPIVPDRVKDWFRTEPEITRPSFDGLGPKR